MRFKRWLRFPVIRRIVRTLTVAAVLVTLTWFLSLVFFRFVSPPLTPLMVIRSIEYRLQGEDVKTEWRWVGIGDLPDHVKAAVVAAEDARYMTHGGVDLAEFVRVLRGRKKRVRGASTITMQTVKNVYLWPGRSYIRKVIEIGMAPIANLLWGKSRTLEIYLNVIEWGKGIYGIEAAARHYFGVPARLLTSNQAGALAAILPSPRTLSPTSLSGASKIRFRRVMREVRTVQLP